MPMISVQEIQTAIETLAPSEQEELLDWVERRQCAIDDRLEADLDAGRFDDMIERALEDEKSGRTRPL